MTALRTIKLLLVAVIACFIVAAVYISTLIVERQDALKQVSRYNTSWLASQAVVEFMRLEQRVSAFGIPGTTVDKDEIQLRLDILVNRLNLLKDGEFQDFVDRDPERRAVVQKLAEAVRASQPLIEHLEQRGAVQKALAILSPVDAKLASLASAANRYGGDRVAEDQQELIRLHWLFSSLAAGLILCGIGLIALLLWHNRLLARAHRDLHALTRDLRKTSGELEDANRAVRRANAELQLGNEALRKQGQELRVQNARFDAALNNMSQGLCMVDTAEQLIVCNERFVQMFGISANVVTGIASSDLFGSIVSGGSYPEEVLNNVFGEQQVLIKERRPGAFFHEQNDGRTIAVTHQPMVEGGWVATYEDITERRRAEARIAYMAHHDALTDLANRVLFREHMEQALSRAERYNESLAVLCLDLDHFKDVNDTLGHPLGDVLLKAVADRLRTCVRDSDVVARLGGDEFAILQLAPEQPNDAGVLASRIVEAIGAPFDLDGHQVVVGASVGVAISPNDGRDADQLLKNADMALYRAKADGRGTFRFFEPGMDAQLQARRTLELDLRKALVNGEFELFYQPLVNLQANRISGFEALLRWNHPVRGMIPPTEFIPVAEEIGLIVPLGEWVVRQACAEAATWPDAVKIAVNLSPAQFKSRNLVQAVVSALAASGLPSTRLELEITESVLLQDNEATLATLHQLRNLGVRIAMDDFGTGYSSLSYLRSFPFDKIKIDQSFVRELSERADCAAIVHSIAGLGSSLGMSTTAEGVETEQQLDQLRAAGCTEVQGYFFDRPKPARDLLKSLAQLIGDDSRAA